MPIFKTSGLDAESKPFQIRFEAPNQEALTDFANQNGITITSIKKVPLSWWPFFKSTFSFFMFFIVLPPLLMTWIGLLSLFINRVTQYSYLPQEMPLWQQLISAGKQGTAVITDIKGTYKRGAHTWFYAYEVSNQKKYSGKIVDGATSLREGRFSRASLIDLDTLNVGQTIPIIYLPDNPAVHAPFKDGNKIQEALDWLKPTALITVGIFVLFVSFIPSWFLYNFLLRLGTSSSLDSSQKIWVLYRDWNSIPAMAKQKSRKQKR